MSDEMGCLDSFCYLKGKAKGMHTNGGCRCVRNLVGRDNPAAGFAIEKRLSELHTQLAASEARVAELEKAQPGKEAANKIAKRLPIWMLDTYDKDSFSSMLTAVSYLKQQVNNESQPGKVEKE